MKPRLLASAGPLEGEVLSLNEAETSIGRHASSAICLNERATSRHHAVIARDVEGKYLIRDLGSLNGTFVNDVPVKERRLEEGDRIQIGDSLFLFLVQEEASPPASGRVRLSEETWLTDAAIQLRKEESVYLRRGDTTAPPTTSRTSRDLNALFEISRAIHSIKDLDQLQQQLLQMILEVVPAERSAILLLGKGIGEFESMMGWSRQEASEAKISVSRAIVEQVLREKVGIVSNNIKELTAFKASKSLVASRITSLLAVPLEIFEEATGLIYLDSTNSSVSLTRDDLQLTLAIAAIASIALQNARQIQQLQDENQRLHSEIVLEHSMIGESTRMREVFQFIKRVAPVDSTVLLQGESGTGKEQVARAIHLNSPRAQRPFLAINCAALTDTLLESELFGHEKGAFTGAVGQKKGKFEAADTGTVFLDEVGELHPTLQAKLLRVLQERAFDRVGGTRPVQVDVRLIAATNKDLKQAVQAGTFRNDLFFRLNVISLNLPPLRDRREDIPLLANYFVTRYGKKCNRRIRGITSEAMAHLERYDWPGNVRELENAIERAVVLGSDEWILPEDLPESLFETVCPSPSSLGHYHEVVAETKKELILKAVQRANHNYTEAARLLGLNPNYLHRLIHNMNLKATLTQMGNS